jgi:hypothetical protein
MRHGLGERVWSQRIQTVIAALSNSGRELFFLPTKEKTMETTDKRQVVINFVIMLFEVGVGGKLCLDPVCRHFHDEDQCRYFYGLIYEALKTTGLSLDKIKSILSFDAPKGDAEMITGLSEQTLEQGRWRYSNCHNPIEIVHGLEDCLGVAAIKK